MERLLKYKDKIIKVIIQIVFFIWMPESFAASLYALKRFFGALAAGNYGSLLQPLLVLAGTIVATVILGRYYCGYICSFGAMQDLAYDIGAFMADGRKRKMISVKTDKILSKVKYLVLIIVIAGAAIGVNIFDRFSPWTGFGRFVSVVTGKLEFKGLFTLCMAALLVIFILSCIYYRIFCHYLCPLGAIYSLASLLSYDKRTKVCKNSGHCSVCRYRCGRYRINYVSLVLTIVVFVITNVFLLDLVNKDRLDSSLEGTEIENTVAMGPYTDGVYECKGKGYRGDIEVRVTVENGNIRSVEVTDHNEDKAYISDVINEMIPVILEKQSTDVDTISGATYSSKGILEAVDRAIAPELFLDEVEIKESNGESVDLSHLEDGVYEGTGIGFRGEITVEVTVEDHDVKNVRILSYYDNDEYLFHVSQAVIHEVVNDEPLDVDAVTGATYSSNGLTRAIADALSIDENTYMILEARPRVEKDKKTRHYVQKFIESDEEYDELVEKYGNVVYGADGRIQK